MIAQVSLAAGRRTARPCLFATSAGSIASTVGHGLLLDRCLRGGAIRRCLGLLDKLYCSRSPLSESQSIAAWTRRVMSVSRSSGVKSPLT